MFFELLTPQHGSVRLAWKEAWPSTVAYRGGWLGGGGGGVFVSNPPPEIPKALQNRAKLNPIVKTVKNC